MLLGAGLGLAALLGSTAASTGGAALAFGIGMAASVAGDALRSKAVKVTRQVRREREDEIQRENAAVDAALYAMEAEQVRAYHLERLLSQQRARSPEKGVHDD